MSDFEWSKTDDLIVSAAREAYATWVRYAPISPENHRMWDDLSTVEQTSWRAVARAMLLRGMNLQKTQDIMSKSSFDGTRTQKAGD